MKKVTNECVDCGLYCLGSDCPNRNVTRYYCDRCQQECDTIYHYNGEELCLDCIIEDLDLEEVV